MHLTNKSMLHFKVVIKGRTKGDQVGGSGFQILVVSVTKGPNINMGIWIIQLKESTERLRTTGGRLFKRRYVVPKLFEFEDNFLSFLEQVQLTGVTPNEVNAREEYRIKRSLQRGFTAHALNMDIEKSTSMQ